MNTATNTAAPTVVRILDVRDTRVYVEEGDRWVAVPGSGISRQCDRCRRDHEVHVDVELSDGTTACIGSGCARGESMEVTETIRKGVATAKRIAKLAAELAQFQAIAAKAVAVDAEVKALELPAFRFVEHKPTNYGRDLEVWACGDCTVFCLDGIDNERRGCMTAGWRQNRYVERMGAGAMPSWWYQERIVDTKRKLARAGGYPTRT